MAEAMTIYQDVLDRMDAALVAGDAGAFLRHIALPCRLETETATIMIDTAGVARRHFDGFAAALRAHRVDAYTRTARDADFVGPGTILGKHDTAITSGGKLVVPRFGNDMEITLHGGVWAAGFVKHHTRYVAWPDVLPHVTRCGGTGR